MTSTEKLLQDRPADGVLRLTLNRPTKRNALDNELRGALFNALEQAEYDDSVRVSIIRGAGPSFCAGYDLAADLSQNWPYHSARGLGLWPRHVTEGCFRIWDLAKPVIAQVHGYCLAGGTELAASCDLVYTAHDAKIGYPAVRSISPPDNQFFPWVIGMRRTMEMMLTGDAINGAQAVEFGFANRAFPAERLDDEVVQMAQRVSKIPADIQQINKRAVHRQMEIMGIRAGIRVGTELQALACMTKSTQTFLDELSGGVTSALTNRDGKFGDYRTSGRES